MPIKQHLITAEHLDALEAICILLDIMPEKFHPFHTDRPSLCGVHYQNVRRNVIFWSPGYGWRLHMDWRKVLTIKRVAFEPQSDRG